MSAGTDEIDMSSLSHAAMRNSYRPHRSFNDDDRHEAKGKSAFALESMNDNVDLRRGSNVHVHVLAKIGA